MLISGFKRIDEESIEEYEDKLSIKLPKQYRTFLLKYNGGETPNTNFESNSEASDIKVFFGIGDVKYSLSDIEMIEKGGKQYLPIAVDSFGNHILIQISDGTIYFENHENGMIMLLDEDLKGFVKRCDSNPINIAATKSVEDREKELVAKGRGGIITEALRDMWRAEIKKYSSMKLEEVCI